MNRILLEAIDPNDGTGQAYAVQQLEERMGGWVIRDKALLPYLLAEQFDTTSE
jgi:hypothetical protein